MIKEIEVVYLPDYATLNAATVNMQNMGDQTIEATFSIDRNTIPDFSEEWRIKFRGVEFIHPIKTPQASKTKEKFNPEYPLTFYHKGIYDLKRKLFFSIYDLETKTVLPDKYEASLSLNIVDFIDAYRKVLNYYYGDYITIDFNTNPVTAYDEEPTNISISYSKMWDVLKGIYDNYNVSWWIEPVDNGKFVIKVGYPRDLLAHQFEYGFEGGLIKVERQVQSSDIVNILLGRGGTKNLPYRYFKDRAVDSGGGGDESTFEPDPDWIPELANIPFDGLRDINFRYYVQGWKDRSAGRRYEEGLHWAYDMGYTAETFDAVEYVKDDTSIAKYGEIESGLQAVEGIYPSIQGVFLDGQGRADQVVEAQQIDDDYEADLQAIPDVLTTNLKDMEWEQILSSSDIATTQEILLINRDEVFTVNEGYKGNLYVPAPQLLKATAYTNSAYSYGSQISSTEYKVIVFDSSATLPSSTGSLSDMVAAIIAFNEYLNTNGISSVAIPAGSYKYAIKLTVSRPKSNEIKTQWGVGSPSLEQTILSETRNDLNTFNIWIKNIWETEKNEGETNDEYSRRVWTPILGNHVGDTAKVVFSTGRLSISEDYEFLIRKFPEYDTSKNIACKDKDGNDMAEAVPSHWKLTLQRSDAEYEATGKYLPNKLTNAEAGDYFFFTGIDLPHQYVVWAEERLNAYKRQQLDDVCEINPTWAIEFAKTRIGSPHADETEALMNKLDVGIDITLFSKWFVSTPNFIKDGGEKYTSTIQSLTFKYTAPTQNTPGILPEVSVTLADKPMTTASTISLIQGSVNALTSRINSMAAPYVIDVIKSTDDVTAATEANVYSAKKTVRECLASQVADEADGLITFNGGLTSNAQSEFKAKTQFGPVFIGGQTGLGGQIDENANAELESLTLRSWLEVPEIRYNRADVILGDQWNAPGGGIVESVEIDTDDNGEPLASGKITLKLERGEIGAVAVNDICKGYYHDFFITGNNAEEDADDGLGNTKFSGFCTVYFRVTEILSSGGVNKVFKYALRPESDNWPHLFHPYEGMHFVAYGNFNNAERQKSAYSTRTYTRYLKNVNTWEFSVNNVAMQFGDLSNLSVFDLDMSGYSAYLQNIYMTGTIQDLVIDAPAELYIDTDTGGTVIAPGETITLTASVKKAWSVLTPSSWSITRDSGNASADATWNAAHTSFDGSIVLTQTDISSSSSVVNALFTITASGDGWTASRGMAVQKLKNGVDGVSSYTHLAYSTSADGAENFSLSYFIGATYLGICVNNSSTAPATASSYTWSRFRGEDGDTTTIYKLMPDTDTIVIGGDGSYTPVDTSCRVIRYVGNDSHLMTTAELNSVGLAVGVSINGGEIEWADYIQLGEIASLTSFTWYLNQHDYDEETDTILDSKSVAVVRDGDPGKNAITFDLDNENASVPCDSAGNPLGTVEVMSTATLYDGASPVPLSNVDFNVGYSNCNGYMTNNILVINSITADSAYATVVATYNGRSYSATLSLSKVRGGADGSSPVIYELRPSASAVTIAEDGTRTPSSVSCAVGKIVGTSYTILSTLNQITSEGLTIYASVDEGDDQENVLSVSTTEATSLEWKLQGRSGTIIDLETIPFVRDGQDGDPGDPGDPGQPGQNAIVAVATPSSITYTAGQAKDVALTIQVMDGNVAKTPTAIATLFNGTSATTSGNVSYVQSSKTLQFNESSTFVGEITFNLTYGGVVFPAKVQVNRVLNGTDGNDGMVYRKTEWALGREYRNDSALTEGIRFLDIAYKTDSNGKIKGLWECQATHTSTASNDPEVEIQSGQTTSTHWKRINALTTPLYTSLILADGAVLGFMQGNQLKIFDSEGNLKAGISASSGSYPIIYANPQRYPVSVELKMYASSSNADNQISNSSSQWKSAVTVAANYYLHMRFAVTYSDGVVEYSTRFGRWRNTTGSAIAVNDARMLYRASNSSSFIGGFKNSDVPYTTVANPYLWVVVLFTNPNTETQVESNWFYIATQKAGTDPTHAMYQQFDNGNATFGMPSGARVLVNATPADGLPRIDIFGNDGNIAAKLDGTWVTSESELYGTGTSSATLSADVVTASTSGSLGDPEETATASSEISLTCAADAVITIPAGTLKVYGKSGTYPSSVESGDDPGTETGESIAVVQTAIAQLWVDNTIIASANLSFSTENQTINALDAVTFSFSKKHVSVSAGTHKVRVTATYFGYAVGYAYAALSNSLLCTIAEGKLLCRYFQNGLAIGSATNNYAMIWNDGTNMQFIVENPTCGLKVTSNKVQIKRAGEDWTNL